MCARARSNADPLKVEYHHRVMICVMVLEISGGDREGPQEVIGDKWSCMVDLARARGD